MVWRLARVVVYGVGFAISALTICFDSCEFAAVPSLALGIGGGGASAEVLIAANGRIQASYSAATVIGPLLAGALVAVMWVETIVSIDAASFLVSAASLLFVRGSFNAPVSRTATTLRDDVIEGLCYVAQYPVLRAISAMLALMNGAGVTVYAQL